MTCPLCHAEIPAGMRFCGHCAAPVPLRCPSCGAGNPRDGRLCHACGTPLAASSDGNPELVPLAAPVGELRRVTILFCDMVDSTSVAERLGAEAMHELIRWFIDTGVAQVHRFGGTAPQFTGDGFMALFGAPIAHEDHERRALLAALAISDAVTGSGAAHRPHHLQMRIGIHTGLVVFGSVGGNLRMDPTAIGDAANVAARLQAAADPGAIVISDDIRRLTQGYVRVEPIGELALKGKGEPITAYRLLSVSHRRVAEQTPAASRPFVNRVSEMALLAELVRPVEEGHGQALGIVGEPGIGKSRLMAEFRRRIGPAATWIEGRCLSYGTTVPYLLMLDLLRSAGGIVETDSPQVIAEKLALLLKEVELDPAADGALLLHLLGIAERSGAVTQSPEAVKTQAFELLTRVLVNSSKRRPLVLLLEDLHWIDNVSDQFVAYLAERIGEARILLLTTYRAGYRSSWLDRSYAGQLPLRPLSRADSLDVVHSARLDLEVPVADAIVARGDGNPLFLEQLALHAGEAADAPSAGLVPQTISDVVMARIDRLPEDTKRLLQTAAIIGREFSLPLLRAAWQGTTPIEGLLRELTRLEFLYERGEGEPAAYVFRHALTQETAYASLLESYRRGLHTVVGRTIEMFYAGRADEVAEPLAFHFGRSSELDKAIDYAIQAAEKAQRRWANSEALAYFDEALRRLDTMPDSEANRLRRIDAVLKQAEVKYALGRYTEQIRALEEIRAIIDECGDPARRASWSYWLGFLHATSGGRPDAAIEYCREAARIASVSGLDEIHAFAGSCLAQVYMVAGRLQEAVEAGERALVYFETRGNRWWAGRTLWFLTAAANCRGDWEASLDYCRRGLQHGLALEDLRLKVVGWSRMGQAYIQQGDIERGLQCCEEALALTPIPRDAAWTKVVRGYGNIKAGHLDAGIAELNEALAWFETSRMRFSQIIGAVWLAEGYICRGDRAAARPLIDYVLTTSRATGYRQYEGRACWLMAECVYPEAMAVAEDHLGTALQIFAQIGARNDVARAMLTRAVLRQAAGDTAMAEELRREADAILGELGTVNAYRMNCSPVVRPNHFNQ